MLSAVPFLAPSASGETIGELQDRMDQLQSELDSAAHRIHELEEEQAEISARMVATEARVKELQAKRAKLLDEVVQRADALYRSGGSGVVEMLFSATDFSELSDRAEILSQVSLDDSTAFVALARSTAELEKLNEDLAEDRADRVEAQEAFEAEANELQARFQAVSEEYKDLRQQLAPPSSAVVPSSGPVYYKVNGNMTCPVAGAVSFIDSWGAPRVGHTHQGVDMMAGYGTPVVAIVSGTITYSGYGSSAGNWQILSGDDGNGYWYMHNQQNLVTGGHVSVGQQIATVGDTGNAAGSPHVHFEFHPGGGGPVNPYPLVASVC